MRANTTTFLCMSADIDEPVSIAESDPMWPLVAAALAEECRAACRDEASLSIEHIGSTAIPGLAAKPVVDLMIGVQPGRREAVAAQLVSAGWTLLGAGAVPGRLYLRRRDGQHANVHVMEESSPLWEDNLLLRDYLRRNPDACARYESAKRSAAQVAPMLLAYSAVKHNLVTALLAEARLL